MRSEIDDDVVVRAYVRNNLHFLWELVVILTLFRFVQVLNSLILIYLSLSKSLHFIRTGEKPTGDFN